MLRLKPFNQSFVAIDCDDVLAMDIEEVFSYRQPGVEYSQAFKKAKGKWDGTIKMFSSYRKLLHRGHIGRLGLFLSKKNIPFQVDDGVFDVEDYDKAYIDQLLDDADLPSKYERRDYQYQAALEAINNKTMTVEAPTASGKSFLCYILILHLLEIGYPGQIALIVPRTGLVEQFYSDLAEYGMDVERLCARLYGRFEDKSPREKVVITTWQSLKDKHEEFFHRFGAVVGDEAHGFRAKSLRFIMENMINAKYRIGTTGTFPKKKHEVLLVEGLLGPQFVAATTDELIKKGYLNQMDPITMLMLSYSAEDRKVMKEAKYQDEIEFIISHPGRNKLLTDLITTLKGNTLLMFDRVEKHGEPLYNSIKEVTDRPVHFVAGKVKTEKREEIRKLVNTQRNAIVIASMGTFSEGVNIPNLDNLVLAMPTKSHYKVVQMIGRVLRKSKTPTRIWDLVDVLAIGNYKNYAMTHGIERIKIYAEKKFHYQMETTHIQEDYDSTSRASE